MPPCLCVSKKSIRPRAIHCADFGNTETQSTRSLCPKTQLLLSVPPCLCVSKKSIGPRAIHCADLGNTETQRHRDTETQSTRSLCPKTQSLFSLCRSDYVGARYLPRWCHGQRRYAQQQALRAAIRNPILARGVGISKVCKVWRESEKLRGLPWVNATMSS